MNKNIDKEFFRRKFTHIGFKNDGDIIIWNNIKDISYNEINTGIKDLDIIYNISDMNLLLNKESKEFFFLLEESGEIFFINIGYIVKKELFNNGSNSKGINAQFLLNDIAYKNIYPYVFVFRSKLSFLNLKNIDIYWDLLNNSIKKTTDEEIDAIDLYFYWESLTNRGFLEYLNIDYLNNFKKEIAKYKKFILKLENNKLPIIEW